MKVSYNGDIITLSPNLKLVNGQPYANTNVKVTFTIPSGLVYVSSTASKGSYSVGPKTWTVGTMQGNEIAILSDFKLKVTNINNAPFTVTAIASGDALDNDISNNPFTWVIEADTCAPAAGANPDISSCLCGSVATNDTVCSKGVTEWRVNNDIVNGTLESWNILTGNYEVKHIDNSQNITFTYNQYCVQGANEYLIAQNVPVTIRASITNKNVYNHTFQKREYSELFQADIDVLQLQHPGVVLSDYCWQVLINANGEVTSGQPLNCDPEKNTKVTFQKIDVNYNSLIPGLGIVFPTNHESGDMHIVAYPNATVYFTSNGLVFSQTVHQAVSITDITVESVVGEPEGTKKITITTSTGQVISSNNFLT